VIEITGLTKEGAPLTKRISLSADGTLHSDGSACVMSVGKGRRLRFHGLAGSPVSQTISDAWGQTKPLRSADCGRPDAVTLATKAQLVRLNGTAATGTIARTVDHITYQAGHPALALIDFDTKGMPADVATRIDSASAVWPALVSVVPDLAKAARVLRKSTSSGISRAEPVKSWPARTGCMCTSW
jgi:hypothetical protein